MINYSANTNFTIDVNLYHSFAGNLFKVRLYFYPLFGWGAKVRLYFRPFFGSAAKVRLYFPSFFSWGAKIRLYFASFSGSAAKVRLYFTQFPGCAVIKYFYPDLFFNRFRRFSIRFAFFGGLFRICPSHGSVSDQRINYLPLPFSVKNHPVYLYRWINYKSLI